MPRMFSVHAISSRAETSMPSACTRLSSRRIIASFSCAVVPQYSNGCMTTGSSGIAGLSVHISSRGSRFVLNVSPPEALRSAISPCVSASEHTIPSMPTSFVPVSASCLPIHSAIVGVPSIFIFISTNSVPASCSAAAMKYLESVHNAAPVIVTTAVPAEPLNPLIHSRPFQCSGTYSPLCGSVLGNMKAPRCSLRMMSRSDLSLFPIMIQMLMVNSLCDTFGQICIIMTSDGLTFCETVCSWCSVRFFCPMAYLKANKISTTKLAKNVRIMHIILKNLWGMIFFL